MYRSTAKRVKRASVWVATAALSVGAGVAAANLASVGSSPTAAPATGATSATTIPAASAPTLAASTATGAPASSSVQTVALSTSVAPTPRTVLSVSAHSLTVRGTSGAITYSVTPSTIILSGTSQVSLSSIHAGSRVIVVPSATSPSVAGTIGILPSTGSGEGESDSRGFDS